VIAAAAEADCSAFVVGVVVDGAIPLRPASVVANSDVANRVNVTHTQCWVKETQWARYFFMYYYANLYSLHETVAKEKKPMKNYQTDTRTLPNTNTEYRR